MLPARRGYRTTHLLLQLLEPTPFGLCCYPLLPQPLLDARLVIQRPIQPLCKARLLLASLGSVVPRARQPAVAATREKAVGVGE